MKKRLVSIIVINILIMNIHTQVVFAVPILDKEPKQQETQTQPESQESTDTQSKTDSIDTDINIDDVFSGADSFMLEIYKDQDQETEGSQATGAKVTEITNKLQPFSISLSNIFITIGTILAVIYASVLGIKFMMGAAEEKAEVKESLVPFVIGCVVIYGAFFIWKIMVNIGKSF